MDKYKDTNKTVIAELGNENFIVVNRDIAVNVGINEAVILGELVSEYSYYKKYNKLVYGWFYSTISNIEQRTTLSERQQRPAIEKLISLGLIEQDNRGIPRKRYFKVNMDKIKSFIREISS